MRRQLKQAKKRAVCTLRSEWPLIEAAFRQHVTWGEIVYDQRSERRIHDAVFMDLQDCEEREEREDELYGETYGDQIWINPWCDPLEMELTLVHEALHDAFHVRRPTRASAAKPLSMRTEHSVMATLECCI